jgi:hypothetical protein
MIYLLLALYIGYVIVLNFQIYALKSKPSDLDIIKKIIRNDDWGVSLQLAEKSWGIIMRHGFGQIIQRDIGEKTEKYLREEITRIGNEKNKDEVSIIPIFKTLHYIHGLKEWYSPLAAVTKKAAIIVLRESKMEVILSQTLENETWMKNSIEKIEGIALLIFQEKNHLKFFSEVFEKPSFQGTFIRLMESLTLNSGPSIDLKTINEKQKRALRKVCIFFKQNSFKKESIQKIADRVVEIHDALVPVH